MLLLECAFYLIIYGVNLAKAFDFLLVFWQIFLYVCRILICYQNAQVTVFKRNQFLLFAFSLEDGHALNSFNVETDKSYALHFLISELWLMQSNAFDSSVRSVPKTFLLSTYFSQFSSIDDKQC